MALVNLTEGQINKIQIDEGIVVMNLGELTEKIIGPTRGGAELVITPTIRDIEYDGRMGKTKGLQVKDGEDVTLTINTLDCSQDMLMVALPGSTIDATTKKITQGSFGVIADANYLTNVAVITKMLDGTFKIITLMNPMHEGAFTYKGVSKAENEHNLQFIGHYNPLNSSEKIWTIAESTTNPLVDGSI